MELLRVFMLLLLSVGANGERVRKASKSTLNKVKKLLEEESSRKQESMQSDATYDFFAEIRRDPRSRRHHDELSVNNIEDYFQGDVDLSEGQADQMAKTIEDSLLGNDEHQRIKRKIGKSPLYKRWKKHRPISFDFAPEIPDETKERIRMAMRLWQANTCIRFEENGPSVDRLEFFDGGGCSSFVGKIGGTQGISISTPGCDIVGIISHEIGHSLGIFHEQARPDQERHIAVNYNNIPIGRWNNFQPVDERHADMLGLPYDTGSVMHYGPFGFSSDPYIPTIRTLDRSQQKTIGQRAGPAFLDYQAINLAYDCLDHCSAPLPKCQRGGYVHPNNCSACLCPDGLAGSLCGNVRLSTAPCGGVLRATKTPQYIQSPNYPRDYPLNAECYWMIQAPPNGRVFLAFEGDMEFALCEDTCDKSYVEVKYDSDLRLTGARFCCPGAPTKPFVSFSNEMMVLMRGYGGTGKGFKARLWTDAGGTGTGGEDKDTFPLEASYFRSVNETRDSTVSRMAEQEDETTVVVKLTTTTTPTTPLPSTSTISPSPTTLLTLLPTLPTIAFKLPPVTRVAPTTAKARPHPILLCFFIFRYPLSVVASESMIPPVPATRPSTTTSVPIPSIYPPGVDASSAKIPVHDCGCGGWTEWMGECSQQCGGCGTRQRKRTCQKDETCQTEEKRPCNFAACPEGTNFLLNNGEVHLLWRGCCIGLFRSGETCNALESNANPFFTLISELLRSRDAYGPSTGGEAPREGAAIRSRLRRL